MTDEAIKSNARTTSNQDDNIKDIRQITNNEAIKSIDDIAPGTKVYVNGEIGSIKSLLKYSANIKVSSGEITTKDFFLDTEHVKLVSEMVKNAKEKLTESFNLPINSEVYHMFEEHRIKMCKNEKNPEEYSKAKEKFDQFIEEYEKAIETLNSLSVGGKPLFKE
ncbi:MAG: hypothetical protein WC875_05360 [Candidatus Absconditabacterales bacterium]